jgi:hypothetical protein
LSHFVESLKGTRAPQHIRAALELLQFRVPSTDRLALLSDAERHRFLDWCDARQVTLMLSQLCNSPLPDWVIGPALQKAAHHELRFERLKQALFEIVDAFNMAGLKFVMLKGLSHAPKLTPDAGLRAQGDIDLWLIGSSVYKGQDVLRSLGYVPLLQSKSRHLSPMARPSKWQWRGNIFDPEMPISVELHYELWSERAEYIAVPDLEQFWERRCLRNFQGREINVLCDADLLGFAALHLLLHLLHGDLPLQRAWEIARFLDTHVYDELFWTSWRSSHPADLRQLETTMFYLVTHWFGCHFRQELRAEVQQLPTIVQSWLAEFSLAPLAREWAPNKSEIWLHLAFVHDRIDRARILFRRLLPLELPCFADRAVSHTSKLPKLMTVVRQLRLVLSRFVRHFVTFLPTLFDGLRWFWPHKSLTNGRKSQLLLFEIGSTAEPTRIR